jgi:hypothetical protein
VSHYRLYSLSLVKNIVILLRTLHNDAVNYEFFFFSPSSGGVDGFPLFWDMTPCDVDRLSRTENSPTLSLFKIIQRRG